MLTTTMTPTDRIQFERFINAAIVHRRWFTSEASKIGSGSENCQSNRRAISDSLRELDEMISRTYLESEKNLSQTADVESCPLSGL
jgi:hypothetical protein